MSGQQDVVLQSCLCGQVNKKDKMHSSEGMDEEETREYVAGLITSQLQGEGFQLRPEQVLHVFRSCRMFRPQVEHELLGVYLC